MLGRKPTDFTEVGSTDLKPTTQLYSQLLEAGGVPDPSRFTLQSLYNFFKNTAGFGFGAAVKHRQFFEKGDAMSLTITVDVATLPADNNDITIHVGGVRIFPDQGSTQLGWSRNHAISPTGIFIRQRDNETVMIEW